FEGLEEIQLAINQGQPRFVGLKSSESLCELRLEQPGLEVWESQASEHQGRRRGAPFPGRWPGHRSCGCGWFGLDGQKRWAATFLHHALEPDKGRGTSRTARRFERLAGHSVAQTPGKTGGE